MRSFVPTLRSMTLAAVAPMVLAATACRSATAPEDHVFLLEVAGARVPCIGSIPQQCLQVRERFDAPYVLFYDSISGFSYEPGYHYLLRVAARTIENPPADGSSIAYRLIAVLSRTQVSW